MKLCNKTLIVFVAVTGLSFLLWTISCNREADVDVNSTEADYTALSGLVESIGPSLFYADGDSVNTGILSEKDYIMLYFSAEWCPPCRQFTPLLRDFYSEYAEKENLEVVFVSLDPTAEDKYQYMQDYKMEWVAVPFDRREETGLLKHYNVISIPRLLVIDSEGIVVKDSVNKGVDAVLREFSEKF